MYGTSIRNIKRNKSEMAVGVRCNRYGDNKARKEGQPPAYSFKNYRAKIASYFQGLFSLDEYLKHRTNEMVLIREHNKEVSRTGKGRFILR